MVIFRNFSVGILPIEVLLVFLSCLFLMQSCKNGKKEIPGEIVELEKEEVIEIVTENMDFQMSDTIPSGWNTFRYKNLSPQPHFFLIDKYPEGKTSEDAENLVAPVFDSAMQLIMNGKIEDGYAEFAKLPEWFSEVKFVGGSGLLSPNQTGETTLNLKPGDYIVECYVKMSNGTFHTSMGMTKDIYVTNTNSGNKALKSDIDIEISSTDGIVFNNTISPGKHIFSVFYKDQIVHENFVGHDVNLVRLYKNANLEELEDWMNWANPKGLMDPAPENITFIGGVNDMPTGSTGFFSAYLKPGSYAIISEVPDASSKNMLKIFDVLR